MAHLASGKRLHLGAARQDASASASASASTSRSQKSHANHGNHGNHGHHAAHGGRASDANMALSLKFSNWRARQSDDGTFASPSSLKTGLAHVEDELTALKFPRIGTFSPSTGADSVRGKPDNGNHASALSASSHGPDGPPDMHRQAHERISRQASSNSSAFSFEVLRRSSLLERFNGQTVNLFELRGPSRDSSASSKGKQRCTLTPASSADSSADGAFVHMQSRKHSVTPDKSQREQLLAALYAQKAAPARSPNSSRSSFADFMQDLSTHAGPSATFSDSGATAGGKMTTSSRRDSAVALSSGTRQNVSLSTMATTTATAAETIRPARSASDPEEDKFSRMLQRLHGNGGPEKGQVRRGLNTDRQQRRDAEFASALTSASTVQHRRPIPGIGRRVDTESDFLVEYLDASVGPSSAAYSPDFGSAGSCMAGVGHHDKGNSLNPKAREFLSFSDADPQAQAQAQAAWISRPPALSSFISSAIDVNPPHVSEGPSPAMYANCLEAPEVDGHGPESGTDPASLNLIPITLETYNPLRVAGAGDGDPRTLFPLVPCVPPMASVPCLPASGAFGEVPVPVRPRPVPKPRAPDSKSQQEYEAWLEWRKANEPGYAMACKARQQRRFQRKTAQQSKSGHANKSV
ncbi:hypothetical protein E4U53_004022 [Claviceps sorghi]|nr:hypothetical protein E4U53_004022 [Claviceps sorghi]